MFVIKHFSILNQMIGYENTFNIYIYVYTCMCVSNLYAKWSPRYCLVKYTVIVVFQHTHVLNRGGSKILKRVGVTCFNLNHWSCIHVSEFPLLSFHIFLGESPNNFITSIFCYVNVQWEFRFNFQWIDCPACESSALGNPSYQVQQPIS